MILLPIITSFIILINHIKSKSEFFLDETKVLYMPLQKLLININTLKYDNNYVNSDFLNPQNETTQDYNDDIIENTNRNIQILAWTYNVRFN